MIPFLFNNAIINILNVTKRNVTKHKTILQLMHTTLTLGKKQQNRNSN